VSRVPPTTSESGKNASGQEAFGTKAPQTPVVESPASLAADVTSEAAGVGTVAAPETDKAGTSAPPTTEDEDDDRGTTGPREELPSRGIFVEGMEAIDDEYRCLYAGTPWKAEVITDRRNLEKFKEVAHTIGTVLLVRILAKFLLFLLRLLECHEVLTTSVARCAVSCLASTSADRSAAGGGQRARRGCRSS
jgi:hypothetical protein